MRLEAVGKRHGRRWILERIDLDVPAAALVVVGGANGCGKSTLLRIACGLSSPTRGQVRGRPGRVAFVPDAFVPPRLDARAFLRHLGRIRGLDGRRAELRIAELAAELAVEPGLDVPLDVLSRGNAKKVALAQAFLAPVDLLVLDEPLATLDEAAVVALERLISRARADGCAVLAAEHRRLAAADSAVHQLRAGRLIEVDAG
jgi:ABC-type multidrug transport system ATPase subunit